jgi:hypothetical protein
VEIEMKKSLLISILLFALVVTFGISAYAGEMERNFGAYLNTLSDQDFASAIVYLKDRPNIRSLDQTLHANRTPLAVRHETVINALKEAAGRSQPSLLNYLDQGIKAGKVEGYTSYWIMNLVVVSATRDELYQIVQRPEVEAIEGNFKPTLIKPVEGPTTTIPTAGIGVTNSLRAINADMVWYNLGITGFGRLVGDLDTGADGDHPAFTDRWRGNWHPWQECWRDALGTGTTYPVDNNGHGTHTLGTMCGLGAATGDTVGVAWEALWIADNSINQSVGPALDNDILGAFQWFTDPDGNPGTMDDVPDVVNSSWGTAAYFGYDYQDCDYRWQAVIEACEAAGVVCTFAAGNEGPSAMTLRSPGNICNTPTVNFSIGAVDAENYAWPYPIASYSSRGPSDCDGVTIKPEVCAPGSYVYSSINNGSYRLYSGTSMATPHVSGVVALMRQANPDIDVQTIKEVLINTSRDLGTVGADNSYGEGFIDAYQAVLAVMVNDTIPPEVTVTAPNGGEVWTAGQTYAITWNATDDMGVNSIDIDYTYDAGTNWEDVITLSGNPGTYNWTVPNTPSTTCLVRVYAYDGSGNQDNDASDAYFTIEPTAPDEPMFVESIGMSKTVWGINSTASATPKVVQDATGYPALSGVTVFGHWYGSTSDVDQCVTGLDGTCTVTSDRVKRATGDFCFVVDGIEKAAYYWDDTKGVTYNCISAAAKLAGNVPQKFSVSENYPNPFNPETQFSLNLVAETHVSFVIYNVTGQVVRTLVDAPMTAGSHTITWNGTNDSGKALSSGIYFYRVIAGDEIVTNRMTLLK